MNRFLNSIALIILVLSSSSSYADSHQQAGVEELSPELRSLLTKEMFALEEGMKAIIPAYISGNTVEISHIAEKMKKSYILKQGLTPEMKKELMSKLPASFLMLDQKFHHYAEMLAHVAENKNNELIGFYYAKLSETCLGCHEQHASHRFPLFNKKLPEGDHSH